MNHRDWSSIATRRETLRYAFGMVLLALAELWSARTGKAASKHSQCRGEGHPCEGNQECCHGLVCEPGHWRSQAKRCQKPQWQGECDDDGDCDDDEICLNGECEPGDCHNDEDCDPGFVCNPHNWCVEDADYCEDDEDCDDWYDCLDGVCRPTGLCGIDEECPEGYFCYEGICVPESGQVCAYAPDSLDCCLQAVKKGCSRKQQTSHARKQCRKKGKRRCRRNFA